MRGVYTCVQSTHFSLTMHCDRDVSKHISQVCIIIRVTENCVGDFTIRFHLLATYM